MSADFKSFLNALDVVKKDYTCGVCDEMCKDPIILSKCFHMICSQHYDSLDHCPTCNTALEGGTKYVDERLGSVIESTVELNKMFESYRNKVTPMDKKRGKRDIDNDHRKVLTENITKSDSVSTKPDLNKSILSNISSKDIKSLEKKNAKGETLLHIACRLGKIEKITELLKFGANTNTKDHAGWTPLHEAVHNGRMDIVALLLQNNTLINVPGPSNETPLHEAVRFNYTDIIEELIRNGADINAANSKGESPLQLASTEVKKIIETAADNVLQTQSLNITRISEIHSDVDYEDIKVYCVSEYRSVQSKLKILTKHHKNIHAEAKMTKKVTHLIVDADDNGICTSSIDVLQGIVCNLWILSTKWIMKSTETKLESFKDYEIAGVGTLRRNGPKVSRFNKYKQLPPLFNGCHFYLHNFVTKYEISKSIVLTKANLTKLITDGGGVVLRRVPNPESIPESEKLIPYHAKKDGKLAKCSHYIIFKDMYEPMYNMQHLKALPVGWLIDCIEKFELCEP